MIHCISHDLSIKLSEKNIADHLYFATIFVNNFFKIVPCILTNQTYKEFGIVTMVHNTNNNYRPYFTHNHCKKCMITLHRHIHTIPFVPHLDTKDRANGVAPLALSADRDNILGTTVKYKTSDDVIDMLEHIQQQFISNLIIAISGNDPLYSILIDTSLGEHKRIVK